LVFYKKNLGAEALPPKVLQSKTKFCKVKTYGGNALPLLTSPSAMYGNRSKTKFLMHLKQSFKSIASFLHRLRRCMAIDQKQSF